MLNIIPINSLSQGDLSFYTSVNEQQLKHYYEPDCGLFLAESPNVIQRALDGGYEPVSFLVEEKYIHSTPHPLLEAYPSTPIYTANHSLLCQINGFPMTRGMLSIMRRKPLPPLSQVCKNKHRIVIMEEVMNPTNLGAIFRSAAALNMEAVLLTKGCCDPLYKRSSRVSMGAVFQIPWTFIEDSSLDFLKKEGFKLVSMALCDNSVSIKDPSLPCEKKLAVFMGSESTGLSKATLSASDYIVTIPMANNVDSLNVAAASAIAFWQLGQP